jgi:hypothetical protein
LESAVVAPEAAPSGRDVGLIVVHVALVEKTVVQGAKTPAPGEITKSLKSLNPVNQPIV